MSKLQRTYYNPSRAEFLAVQMADIAAAVTQVADEHKRSAKDLLPAVAGLLTVLETARKRKQIKFPTRAAYTVFAVYGAVLIGMHHAKFGCTPWNRDVLQIAAQDLAGADDLTGVTWRILPKARAKAKVIVMQPRAKSAASAA